MTQQWIAHSEDPSAIARVKEYWDRRPCNIRHSASPVGTRQYFDEVEARKYLVEPHIPGFAQFDRWRDKRVLEIGTGIGTDAINFARAGAHVTAVELSETSLNLCRRRFAEFGLTADFYQQNAETLGETLRGSDFDLIYSFGVIHHSPSPEKIIEQIRLLSNPNTEVRIMLYSKFSWKVFWILMKYGRGAFWRLPQLVAKYSEAETGCPITYTYSFKDVRKLMKGFEILELRKEHIFPYRIDKYVNYEYEKVWYFKLLPERLFRSLEHRIGWHTLVVARPSP